MNQPPPQSQTQSNPSKVTGKTPNNVDIHDADDDLVTSDSRFASSLLIPCR